MCVYIYLLLLFPLWSDTDAVVVGVVMVFWSVGVVAEIFVMVYMGGEVMVVFVGRVVNNKPPFETVLVFNRQTQGQYFFFF